MRYIFNLCLPKLYFNIKLFANIHFLKNYHQPSVLRNEEMSFVLRVFESSKCSNIQRARPFSLRFISVHLCLERLNVMSQQIIWEAGKSGEIAGLVMLPFPPITI